MADTLESKHEIGIEPELVMAISPSSSQTGVVVALLLNHAHSVQQGRLEGVTSCV